MYKAIRKNEASVRHIADNKLARNYVTKDISPNVSLAVTEASYYAEEETTPYDRIYFILDGILVLAFDEEEVQLHPGDSCFVAKNSKYTMKGTFTAVMVNQPAFGT